MKRHEDALAIMEGARNVCAIARSLLAAAEEAAGEGVGAENDAAVRMIVYRLSRLCRIDEIAYGFDPVTLADVYCMLMEECKKGAEGDAKSGEKVILLRRPSPSDRPEIGPR